MNVSSPVAAAVARTKFLVKGLETVEIHPVDDHLVIHAHGQTDCEVSIEDISLPMSELRSAFKREGVVATLV